MEILIYVNIYYIKSVLLAITTITKCTQENMCWLIEVRSVASGENQYITK